MKKANIAIIGMEVMGRSLALNMESKGYTVAVYNRTAEKTKAFAEGPARGKNIIPTYELKDLVDSLESPKKIMLMVKEGQPVDNFIETLLPYLKTGDLIIDGGNSFFKDTIRRNKMLSEKGILFIGTGVSGGEEGALKGPAIMPGGQKEAYNLVEKIFRDISAKAYDGEPCVDYIGPDGAGHFVKTIHNGIEYGDMQLIGEVAWFFKNIGMRADEIAEIMAQWNGKDDILRSYLIEITADSMKQKHQGSDEFLVDRVADITRMKGTGTWTVQSALELLVPIPTIAAAVFSREMSQDKQLRLSMAKKITIASGKFNGDKKSIVEIAHDALYIAKISSYAQGIALLQAASKEYNFNLNIGRIAKIWRAGCIIRAQFLDEITKAYEAEPDLPNLLAAPKFASFVETNAGKLAKFIDIAHHGGVPVLAMSGALDYIMQITSPVMPSAQVSALQRDYFGAHGYFKIGGPDDPELVTNEEGKVREFHTEWLLPGRPEREITK
ncbi:MAG TPA: NADP-dependent phosphogluconate dehydrogenase [bacterium]|nr:NADP-dependent phosphogluconate dehydrogenase [bacterium]HOL50138.1 NADP-dependent phosphogluconate dehydrogenase [bacterium]HPO51315.1 NADP-dependent phosphogluconate dehydrogenase [bacterium]